MIARLGIIGFGNIASTLFDVLARDGRARFEAVSVLCPPGMVDAAKTALAERAAALADEVSFHESVDAYLATSPDLTIECAVHQVVRETVPEILKAGCETIIVSIGALADDATTAALEDAAAAGRTRVALVSGAIGGIDALAAARLAGIEEVIYTGRKPPHAWTGTPAEEILDLSSLAEEAMFFSGTARAAATQYPKNANVAATLALAGVGFDRTRVRLIADPAATGNTHEYEVRSASVNYTIRLEGKASPDNPKTSVSTVYSVAREVLNRIAPLAI